MPIAKSEIKNVTIWRHPVLFIRTFLVVVFDLISSSLGYVATHLLETGVVMLGVAGIAMFLSEPPAQFVWLADAIVKHGSFATYWVVLGVLSSIGLGSGLHTFVLFLGPHIARVATTAKLHSSTQFSAQIDQYFSWPQSWSDSGELATAFSPQYAPDAFEVTLANAGASFLAVLQKVAPAAFLWGLGTALGELPPYFIARAARRSGEALEELEEIDSLEREKSAEAKHKPHAHLGFLDRAKMVVFESIQRYGFGAILLAASIPNPLFDLAGLTCGHFGISFWTFFGATFVGKAIIKVSIQVFFIVAMTQYGPTVFAALQEAIPANVAFVKGLVSKVEISLVASQQAFCRNANSNECDDCCDRNFGELQLNHCKAMCDGSAKAAQSEEGVVKQLFGYVLLVMIGYFVLSMVNAAVQERLIRQATVPAHEAVAHHHPTHVHGSQVISALVNVQDLVGPAAINTTTSSASTGSGSKRPRVRAGSEARAPPSPAAKAKDTPAKSAAKAVAPPSSPTGSVRSVKSAVKGAASATKAAMTSAIHNAIQGAIMAATSPRGRSATPKSQMKSGGNAKGSAPPTPSPASSPARSVSAPKGTGSVKKAPAAAKTQTPNSKAVAASPSPAPKGRSVRSRPGTPSNKKATASSPARGVSKSPAPAPRPSRKSAPAAASAGASAAASASTSVSRTLRRAVKPTEKAADSGLDLRPSRRSVAR